MTPRVVDPGSRRSQAGSEVPEVLVALYRAANMVQAFLERVIHPHGITGPQYNVLRILRGAGPNGLPTLTIVERMIERAPGITRMIDRLERKGLVERERGTDDRRCVHCRITRAGLDLLKRMDRPVEQADRDAFAGLSSREMEQLAKLLQRIRPAQRREERAES
jgi:DNA-binding MarR family transcriptional regulator